MKSLKKYICIAVVAVLATAGITGCGWWKDEAEQIKESNVSSSVPATQDPLADNGDEKKDVAVNDEVKKSFAESSDGTGVISAPEVLIDQDAISSSENKEVKNPTGNQNGGKPEQAAVPGRQDNNGDENQTDSSHDGNNNTGNGSDNSGNKDSGNQRNNGRNGSSGNQGNNNSDNGGTGNQGNNDGNNGSNVQEKNGGNADSGDRENNGNNTGIGDQVNDSGNGNDNGGNTGTGDSQGIELPEIPID